MKCNVVMLSYRGYGKSEGSPSEKGLRTDAQTFLDFVRAYPSIKDTKLILYGQSIGGAVSIDLASRNQSHISGLIVENTFLSLPRLVPSIMPVARPFVPLLKSRWDSASLIQDIDTHFLPVLFISGRADTLIPPSHMDELFQLCGKKFEGSRKRMEKIEGGNHNDTCTKPKYFSKILQFIRDEISPLPSLDVVDKFAPQVEKEVKEDTAELVKQTQESSGSDAGGSAWEKVSAASVVGNGESETMLDTL